MDYEKTASGLLLPRGMAKAEQRLGQVDEHVWKNPDLANLAERAKRAKARMGGQFWVEPMLTIQGDGPALTAAAAASMLPTAARALPIPPQFWYLGKAIRIIGSGRISSVVTTPGTARYDMRLGPTNNIVVFDGLAILLDTVAAHTNVGWCMDLLLTCVAIGTGTTAKLMGQGRWTCEDILGVPATAPKGVLTAMLPWNSAPAPGTGFDSTVVNVLDMFFTQTAATGSQTLHQLVVESIN